MSVSMVKIADQSTGATRQYQALNRTADENSASRIKGKDKDGNDAIFTKIKTNDGYKYVLCSSGEDVDIEKERTAFKEKKESIFSKNGRSIFNLWNCFGLCDEVSNGWDKMVDSGTNFVDQNVLGVDENKATIDGKDDGKISGQEKTAYFVKGVADPLVGMAKNPVKTVVAGVAIGAAVKGAVAGLTAIGVACPPAGIILAGAALIAGIGLLAWNGIKALRNNAKTDAEARATYRGMGTGAAVAVSAGIGLKKMGAQHKAAVANQNYAIKKQKYLDWKSQQTNGSNPNWKLQGRDAKLQEVISARQEVGLSPKTPTTSTTTPRGGLAGAYDDAKNTAKAVFQKPAEGIKNMGSDLKHSAFKIQPDNPTTVSGTKPGFWSSKTGFGIQYKTDKAGIDSLIGNIKANVTANNIPAAKAQLSELYRNISAIKRGSIPGLDASQITAEAKNLESLISGFNPSLSAKKIGYLASGTGVTSSPISDMEDKAEFDRNFKPLTMVE